MEEKAKELKGLLGIPENDTSKDSILMFLLQTVTNRILIYCNIQELPKLLEQEVILMCIETYRQTALGKEQHEEELKAVSRGDTSYSYASPSEIAIKHINSPAFLNEHKIVINKFRKMRR